MKAVQKQHFEDKDYFTCSCFSPEHTMSFWYDQDENEFYDKKDAEKMYDNFLTEAYEFAKF